MIWERETTFNLPGFDPPTVGRSVLNLVTVLITIEAECANTQNSMF